MGEEDKKNKYDVSEDRTRDEAASTRIYLIATIFHRHDALSQKWAAHCVVVSSIHLCAACKNRLSRRILGMYGKSGGSAGHYGGLSWQRRRVRGARSSRLMLTLRRGSAYIYPDINGKLSQSKFFFLPVSSRPSRSVSLWAQRFVLLVTF